MKAIIWILLGSVMLAACNKADVKQPANFDVTAANTTVKAGTAVTFNISGTPDDIVFYSGEFGKTYVQKDLVEAPEAGNPEMEFQSNVQFGTTTLNNVTVLVSNNFNGVYDSTNVKAATWTDVTSRLKLGTSATNLSSGVVNLNDLKAADKPFLYVAFRYLSDRAATLKQRQWTIGSFQFRTRFPDGKVFNHATSIAEAGFGSVEFKGDSTKWVPGTSLFHAGLAAGYPSDDDWSISRAFNLRTLVPERKGSVNIKSIAQASLPQYRFTYSTPGTYKATFVATNQNIDKQEQVVKEVTVTVTQ
ncbi:DUF5017 domain-containing protein [Mucilaginibacter sp. PAMB04274]|uniref:DUF5017 domain-containing protein n=1 Tax=Mucilaginibacter sp. PAMB04274 TaxID=3138568 RepID=UPI0031F71433